MKKNIVLIATVLLSISLYAQKKEVVIDGKTYILKEKRKIQYDTVSKSKWEIGLAAGLSTNTTSEIESKGYKLKLNYSTAAQCLYNVNRNTQLGIGIDATQLAVMAPYYINASSTINTKYFTASPASSLFFQANRVSRLNTKTCFATGFAIGYTQGQKLSSSKNSIREIQEQAAYEIQLAGNNYAAIHNIESRENAELLALNGKAKTGGLSDSKGVMLGLVLTYNYDLGRNITLKIGFAPRYYLLFPKPPYNYGNVNCLAFPITLGLGATAQANTGAEYLVEQTGNEDY